MRLPRQIYMTSDAKLKWDQANRITHGFFQKAPIARCQSFSSQVQENQITLHPNYYASPKLHMEIDTVKIDHASSTTACTA